MFNDDIMQKLREFLKSVPEEELKDVLRQSKILQYSPGQVIIEEGSVDSWIYFLVSGQVRIVKQGEEVCVTKRVGEIFGEMSAIDGSPKSAGIFAVDDCMCLVIDAANLDKKLIYKEFSVILVRRLRQTTEELIETKKELERLNAGSKKDTGVKRDEQTSVIEELISAKEEIVRAKEEIVKAKEEIARLKGGE